MTGTKSTEASFTGCPPAEFDALPPYAKDYVYLAVPMHHMGAATHMRT